MDEKDLQILKPIIEKVISSNPALSIQILEDSNIKILHSSYKTFEIYIAANRYASRGKYELVLNTTYRYVLPTKPSGSTVYREFSNMLNREQKNQLGLTKDQYQLYHLNKLVKLDKKESLVIKDINFIIDKQLQICAIVEPMINKEQDRDFYLLSKCIRLQKLNSISWPWPVYEHIRDISFQRQDEKDSTEIKFIYSSDRFTLSINLSEDTAIELIKNPDKKIKISIED